MRVLLSCDAVAVQRGRRRILSDVCLTLRAGESVHLGGANGSGKTSLLRVLAGVAHPQSGRLERSAPCAYVPEKVVLAPTLRPAEWLEAMRRIRGGAPRDWAAAAIDSGLDSAVLSAKSFALSKGMFQRIALIEAVHSGCPVLLLDEPFAGLDAAGRDWLGRGIARCLDDGAGVLVIDHSGAAGAWLARTRALELIDGRCEVIAKTRGATRVHVVATNSAGERIARDIDPATSDAVLRDLLDAGWHIESVTR